mmetsp:Transcript_133723/g.427538  ORF Transcript_133723/g.427538 Transcript_133723/m.427538 type:complete len:381 (+) Transcript_133723:16-1158(+)
MEPMQSRLFARLVRPRFLCQSTALSEPPEVQTISHSALVVRVAERLVCSSIVDALGDPEVIVPLRLIGLASGHVVEHPHALLQYPSDGHPHGADVHGGDKAGGREDPPGHPQEVLGEERQPADQVHVADLSRQVTAEQQEELPVVVPADGRVDQAAEMIELLDASTNLMAVLFAQAPPPPRRRAEPRSRQRLFEGVGGAVGREGRHDVVQDVRAPGLRWQLAGIRVPRKREHDQREHSAQDEHPTSEGLRGPAPHWAQVPDEDPHGQCHSDQARRGENRRRHFVVEVDKASGRDAPRLGPAVALPLPAPQQANGFSAPFLLRKLEAIHVVRLTGQRVAPQLQQQLHCPILLANHGPVQRQHTLGIGYGPARAQAFEETDA